MNGPVLIGLNTIEQHNCDTTVILQKKIINYQCQSEEWGF